MQDPDKIKAKLAELGSDWMEADGNHALTTVNYADKSNVVFNPASGIIVKVFVKPSTGELKYFLADNFEK